MSNEYKGVPENKKKLMIFGTLFLMVGMMAANYSNNVLLPKALSNIDGMHLYALITALNTVGMMIGLPISGSLSAKVGTKTLIIFGIIAQFVTKILLLVIGNPILFAADYFFMGFFGGLYMSAPYAVMAELVSPQERPKYFGFLAAMSAVGALVGPLVTGLVADAAGLSVAWPFYIIFIIIPFILYLMFYPNVKRSDIKFDVIGLVYLVLFVLPLIFWLTLGGNMFKRFSAVGILILAAAIAGLVLMITRESKIDNPVVPVRMFTKPRFRTTFVIAALIVSYSVAASGYGIRYAQEVMKVSTTVSSTVTMPQTIVQFIVGILIGAVVGKSFKKKFRAIGLISILAYIIPLLMLWRLTPNSSIMIMLCATAIGGIGQGISQSQYAAFFQSELKMEEIRPAQGMYQFAQTGFAAIISAIIGLAQGMGATLNDIFLLGAVICGIALVIAIFGFRFPKDEIAAEEQANAAK